MRWKKELMLWQIKFDESIEKTLKKIDVEG